MPVSRRDFVGFAAATLWLGPAAARAAEKGGGMIAVPVRLIGSRLAVALTLGSKGTYNFALDTGAYSSLIRSDLAKSLGLASFGQTRFNGRGLTLYAAHDVIFGGAFRQEQVTFAGLDGDGLGENISGTLAAGVITELDSDIDFLRGQWRVYPNGRSGAPEGFVRLDSQIAKGGSGLGSAFIFVNGILGGRKYRFLIDTGAPGNVMLYAGAAKSSIFARPDIPFAPVRPSNSNGPGTVSPLVRGDLLDLGNGIRLEKPLVVLNQTGDQHFPGVDGIIGLSLLRQLNLATDTRSKSLWATLNGIGAPTDTYPRSGIWIDRGKNGVRVSVVGVGSPAAAQDIRAGDIILDMDFETALRALSHSAGTKIQLAIERDGIRRRIDLVLADYL